MRRAASCKSAWDAALQKGGITAVPTVTWVDLVSFNLPQGAAAG